MDDKNSNLNNFKFILYVSSSDVGHNLISNISSFFHIQIKFFSLDLNFKGPFYDIHPKTLMIKPFSLFSFHLFILSSHIHYNPLMLRILDNLSKGRKLTY